MCARGNYNHCQVICGFSYLKLKASLFACVSHKRILQQVSIHSKEITEYGIQPLDVST